MDPFLGGIYLVPYNFAPRGFAFCNGQLLSIAQNTALFSLLGTTFGGNGVSTFSLPDLRGRVAVGVGQGSGLNYINLGEIGGSETVTILTNNMPTHTHIATVTAGNGSSSATLNAVSESGNTPIPTGNYLAASKAATNPGYKSTGSVVALNAGSISNVTSALPSVTNSVSGNSQPINIMPPYLGLNYIIALQGVFPSRN